MVRTAASVLSCETLVSIVEHMMTDLALEVQEEES